MVDLSDSLPDGRLAAGATITSRTLTISNPDSRRVDFGPGLYDLPYPNQSPIFTTVPPQGAIAGQPYRFTVNATDPDGTQLTYLLHRGPEGLSVDANTGEITWSPTAASPATSDVTLRVYDSRGGYDTATFNIAVAGGNHTPEWTPPPSTLFGAEGETLTFSVGATDPDGDRLIYRADNLPGGARFNPLTRVLTWTPGYEAAGVYEDVTFIVSDGVTETQQTTTLRIAPTDQAPTLADTLTPTHLYQADGVYTVTLTVTDSDGASTSEFLGVTVRNVAPTIADLTGPLTLNEGDTATFTATATDPGNDRLTYTWNFGDSSSPIQGSEVNHTFANNGIYTVSLTVTDQDGASTAQTLTVAVNNVAPTIVLGSDLTTEAGTPLTFSGSIIDPGTLDPHTVEWDFGDGTTVSDTLTPTHTYIEAGLYTVTLTVTDDQVSVTETLTVTVNAKTPTFAIVAEGTATINNGGNFVGDPLDANDDAFVYAGQGFTINNSPELPVLRDDQGNPILDDQGPTHSG